MPQVAFLSCRKSQSTVGKLDTGQRISRKGANFGYVYEEDRGPEDVVIYYLLQSIKR